MNTKLKFLLPLLTALLTGCSSSDDNSPPEQINSEQNKTESELQAEQEQQNQEKIKGLKGELDNYLSNKITDEQAGLAVIVRKDGEVIYQNALGLANADSGLLIDSTVPFRVGSISKPFTAIAIMQLYEQNLVDLQASVRQYLPELPESWQDMTIHHLLTHQSGAPHRTEATEQGIDSNAELIEYFTENDSRIFSAGSRFEYSTTGFILLAEVVARVSNVSFPTYVQTNIFSPANMNNSWIVGDHLTEEEYWPDGMAISNAIDKPFTDFLRYFNGGFGQVSSLDDLNSFANALLDGQLVSLDTLELMTRSHVRQQGTTYWGYGWQVLQYNSKTLYRHMGTFAGFRTGIEFYEDDDIEIIYLANGDRATNIYKLNIFNIVRRQFGIWPTQAI